MGNDGFRASRLLAQDCAVLGKAKGRRGIRGVDEPRPRAPSSIGLGFGRVCFRHSRSSTRPLSAFTGPAAPRERAPLPFAHTGCTASRDWLIARPINPPVGKALVARAMGAAAGAPASLSSGGMKMSAGSVIKAGIYCRPPLTTISIPLPATIPRRKAAKRATAICASNIVIVLVKHWSCVSDNFSEGGEGDLSSFAIGYDQITAAGLCAEADWSPSFPPAGRPYGGQRPR
jgi:hypothetical protein